MGGGKIYKILPDNPEEPQLIDTGFAVNCNNDHIISFNGEYLIVSHSPEGEGSKIYTLPFSGGEEIRLTTAEDLDDGPEYSPDGQHIWFNSVRSGLMQIWRMNNLNILSILPLLPAILVILDEVSGTWLI